MKPKIFSAALLILSLSAIIVSGYRCSGTKKTADAGPPEIIRTNIGGLGIELSVEFIKGGSHNHPLMAVWLEDTTGKYLETLYVSESIGKGIFRRGDKSKGTWEAGPVRRPAALPYWGHKRGIAAEDGYYIPTPDNPMPDAVTGPTPTGSFSLQSRTSQLTSQKFRVMFEINQSWDWNEYWTNNKFQDDINYRTSSQPSLVYEAVIDPSSATKEYPMVPVGHGHYSGLDGNLYTDLSTLTTALEIAKSIRVSLK